MKVEFGTERRPRDPEPVMPTLETGPQGVSEAAPVAEPLLDSSVFHAGPEQPAMRLIDPGLPNNRSFPFAVPDAKRIDVPGLHALVASGEANKSDGLIVIADGKTIAERYYGTKPRVQSIQSVTKSISSLAVGFLMDEGKIKSLDTPLSTYYPEWGVGDKATATVRHVLTMSTGVQDDAEQAFFNQSDLLAYARAQTLVTPPGQKFSYSDLGVQLLSGVVKSAAGEPIDTYLHRKLFDPLGITHFRWEGDTSGSPEISGGLFMAPRDLAKIGAFALSAGKWKGKSLLSADWLAQSGTPSATNPAYGLLWWLKRVGDDVTDDPAQLGPVTGMYALGYGGQFVFSNPAANMVGVRTLDIANADQATFMGNFPGELTAVGAPH